MSQTDFLFSVTAPVNTFAATTGAPTPKQFTKAGNTIRLVNTDTTNGVFVAVGDAASGAIATLPVDGSVVSNWVAPGADYTMTLNGNSAKYWSAITIAGTAALLAYIGDGA